MSARKNRPYIYYDQASTICSTCLAPAEGKITIEEGRVHLRKWCREHGHEKVLLADDADYWRFTRERFLKPAELPRRFHTKMEWGCPYDCGLCPDHQQHACLAIIEITDHCNLRCPVCYAQSGPHRPGYRSLERVEKMLDAIVATEGTPDVVQISGGEPTLHPQLMDILHAAKARPIRHLMLNTNGIELARRPELVEQLAAFQPGFEVYLQFDGLDDTVNQTLRGADLAKIRRKALANLEAAGLSTTLVVTLKRGLNDHLMGEIIDFGLSHRCVRGVTFQPVQEAGRVEGYDPALHRLTVSEVRRRIGEQSPLFEKEDILPVPCHPDCLAMAYALRSGDSAVPLSRYVTPEALLAGPENTITYEKVPALREHFNRLFSTGEGPAGQAEKLGDLLCCLPRVDLPQVGYQDVFRVLIVRFMDARDFDVRSVKKSCIHFVQEDGRVMPFDTWNLLYREPAQRARLEQIRASLKPPLVTLGRAGARLES